MRTIKNTESRLVAINEAHIVSAVLGCPDRQNGFITYRPTKIELITGTVVEICQDDPENNDFLIDLFGFNWEEYYQTQPEIDE